MWWKNMEMVKNGNYIKCQMINGNKLHFVFIFPFFSLFSFHLLFYCLLLLLLLLTINTIQVEKLKFGRV